MGEMPGRAEGGAVPPACQFLGSSPLPEAGERWPRSGRRGGFVRHSPLRLGFAEPPLPTSCPLCGARNTVITPSSGTPSSAPGPSPAWCCIRSRRDCR
ncbi:hypothetical protein DPM33_31540 [Mesorhizobium hawassense]|uniref:Uncharacterized protein n=1 Tax=Mesorhizobium hawassense TaxID=1209954 RepID=A0A330H7H0_9HYPH|nr:hypothetical protein DPM33_31540 [Mesorhizobium hawassense]